MKSEFKSSKGEQIKTTDYEHYSNYQHYLTKVSIDDESVTDFTVLYLALHY